MENYHREIFPEFNNNNYYQFGKKFKSSNENIIKITYYKPNEILKKLPNIANNNNFTIDSRDLLIYEEQIKKCKIYITFIDEDNLKIDLEMKATNKIVSNLKNYFNFKYQESNKKMEIKINNKAKML